MKTSERKPLIFALLLSFFLLLLYLLTLPRGGHLTDSYDYLNSIAEGKLEKLFHPHHLIFNFIAWLVFVPLKNLNPAANPWLSTQVLNGLLGAGGIFFFALLLIKLTRNYRLSLLGSLGLAFSFGWWHFSGELEVYVMALFFLSLSLFWLYKAVAEKSITSFILLALFTALSLLSHQSSIFFLPGAVLAILFCGQKWGQKLKLLSIYLFFLLLFSGLPYLAVAFKLADCRDLSEVLSWLTRHGQAGYANGFKLLSLPAAMVGQFRGLMGCGGLLDLLRETNPAPVKILGAAFFPLVFTLSLLLLLGLMLSRFKLVVKSYPLWLLAGGVWYISAALFSLWYDPANYEWWTLPLLPFWLLLSLGAAGLAEKLKLFKLSRALMLVMVISLLLGNLSLEILPRMKAENDPLLSSAKIINRYAKSGDLVVLPTILSFRLIAVNPQIEVLWPFLLFRDSTFKNADFYLRTRITECLKRGGTVFISEPLFPADEITYFHKRGIQEDLKAYNQNLVREGGGTAVFSFFIPWEEEDRFGQVAKLRELKMYKILNGKR